MTDTNTGQFVKGNTPWNAGIKGYSINYPLSRKLKISLTESHKLNISRAVPKAESHFCWKGDNVGKAALHDWVYKTLGSPKKCECCGKCGVKRLEWANKSGKYLRKISDWLRLCTSCHRQYDLGNNSKKAAILKKIEELKKEADSL